MSHKDNPAYTDLEEREIALLTDRIQTRTKLSMKQLHPIADDMIELLEEDTVLKVVYNKKTTIIGSLRKIFLTDNLSPKHNKDAEDRITQCEEYIERRLHEEEQNKKKEQARCSRSLSACVIL